MSGGIWGDVPLTEESGRYPTPPEQSLAAALVKGMWSPVDYVGRVARGQSAVFDPETGHVGDEAIKWAADQAINRGPSRVPVSPGEVALGAGPITAYHGSPTAGLRELRPSERGPLGPGVYLSPAEQVAKRYAGSTGTVYEKTLNDADIFQGIKSRDSGVNPYQVWRDQTARLVDAAEPGTKQAIADLAGRMDPSDGYPFFARLSQLLGGNDKAQSLIQRAGYKGMSGTVDGPEIVHYGAVPLYDPIKAYHGSPHDFDRFDMSKIGTGEGAQAYGHGLYFAENEAVARGYRDALAPKVNAKRGGLDGEVADYFNTFNGDDAAIQHAIMQRADYGERKALMERYADLKALNMLKGGRMYEVAIHADPERFLDWDKPLSAQPAELGRAMYGSKWDDYQGAKSALSQPKPTLDEMRADPRAAQDALVRRYDAERAMKSLSGIDDGRSLPAALYDVGNGDMARASTVLREQGIPGIKYLDAGSRTAGDGSRNFVTFDDKLVEILRKYGILGPAALGAGSAAMTMPQGNYDDQSSR